MRLLLLSSEFPPGPGGIGTHAYQLAHHLGRMGWEVVVATPQHHATRVEVQQFNRSLPFRIVTLAQAPGAPLKALYRWHVISRLIRQWLPDILLASGDREVYLGARLAKSHGLPWVAVEHGRVPPRWERPLKRWSFGQASTVVCVSRYTLQRLLVLGVRPRSHQVITNGADISKFRVLPSDNVREFRRQLGLNGKRVLLTVGSVTHRKGQDVVIRALPRILEKIPNTHYVMAGLPVRQTEFARIAQQLGVSENVSFLGQVDDNTLLRLLNSCDVFVMTSRHTAEAFEGFGIAVVEAALCAKPAVVSANSGLAEAILDSETGFTVPENDEVATSHKITILLDDERLRLRMGHAAREHALARQTWEHRVKEYDVLLCKVAQLTVVSSSSNLAQEREVIQ